MYHTGFLLRRLSTSSFSAFSEIVGKHGLHPMHFGMVMIIDAEESISQQEVSGRTGNDPSTLVARMDVPRAQATSLWAIASIAVTAALCGSKSSGALCAHSASGSRSSWGTTPATSSPCSSANA